jgi:hypothetical protein
MKRPIQKRPFAVMLAALAAALAAIATTSQAQSLQDLTNGLVDYYPLDQLSPGTTNVTPDLLNRRDLLMTGMSANNIVAGSHSGMGDSTAVMNCPNSPGPTVMVYEGTGQSALDGSGDFLPFINQRGATMNFWIKGNPAGLGNDLRVMAECANNGDGQPFFSLSTQPAGQNNTSLGYFLRESGPVTDPNGVSANKFDDGTYQTPPFNYIWSQSSQYTTNVLFDNNWHMLTTEIETNGDVHVFVDGNYDPGNQSTATLDNEGNPALAPPLNVINTYYNTNIYPFGPMTTNGGTGLPYVHWMLCDTKDGGAHGAFTAFGGYDRNGGIVNGPACQLSDIGFWNRTLTINEIQWLMTNGLTGLTLNTGTISINSFYADFGEIGTGNSVNIHWNVTGASASAGGVVISGIGDVSATPVGSTNITLGNNASYTFTLTAHNGVVADKEAVVTVQTLAGVSSDWHLIQRFDGLFGNTTAGINANNWVSLLGNYAGNLDRFNVVTVNGNKVLSPKSGYLPDAANSPIGWDTPGALTYGNLNGLTIPPYQANTLFFRFSVTEPATVLYGSTPFYSGLDFAVGLTDFGFATGPLGGTQPPGGGGGTVGPGFRIVNYDPSGLYQPAPFDLMAEDNNGSSGYDYLTATNGDPSGLLTNVTYYCWMDVSNDNTHAIAINGASTNNFTTNEAIFSLWIQKQGDPSRTLLFSGFHGNRDYTTAGQNSDNPTPYLNKVFVSVASENILNSDNGAFLATNNMILLDDFYLSKSGYASTIPRLFNIRSIVRGATNATINWESLGSMFQTNTYSVQRTFSLNPPTWVTLTNGLPSGGDFTSFTDNTVGSANTAFYRISWP